MARAFLTPELAREVRKLVRSEVLRNDTQIKSRGKRRIPRSGDNERPYIGLTNEEISARSGTTLGSGGVSLYDNTDAALSDTTDDVTAYNFGANTIASGTYVQLERCGTSGDWFITAVDCGA